MKYQIWECCCSANTVHACTHTPLFVRMQALSSVSSIEQLFISAAAAVESAVSDGNYTALLMLHDHTSNQVSYMTYFKALSLRCLHCAIADRCNLLTVCVNITRVLACYLLLQC
jgi:hypothetical protein